MKEGIKEYIQKGLKKNFSMDTLKAELLKAGWPENEIDYEIKKIEEKKKTGKKKKEKRPLGIKITTYSSYLLAALIVLNLIYSLISQSILNLENLLDPSSQTFILIALIAIAIGISLIFVTLGGGIWSGKKISRLILIIVLGVDFFASTALFISSPSTIGVIYPVITLVTLAILLFDKKTKKWSNKK